MPRIAPAQSPYAPDIQAAFDKIMPAGVPPLLLFRTLARSTRVYHRFNSAALLDRGPLTLRQREIAIDRTCALTGCAYEWGVHIALFGARVGFDAEQQKALAGEGANRSGWARDERAIINLCDELHASAHISDGLWQELRVSFTDEQILELIALAGFYRTVAYFANGLELAAEDYAAPLPKG